MPFVVFCEQEFFGAVLEVNLKTVTYLSTASAESKELYPDAMNRYSKIPPVQAPVFVSRIPIGIARRMCFVQTETIVPMVGKGVIFKNPPF